MEAVNVSNRGEEFFLEKEKNRFLSFLIVYSMEHGWFPCETFYLESAMENGGDTSKFILWDLKVVNIENVIPIFQTVL